MMARAPVVQKRRLSNLQYLIENVGCIYFGFMDLFPLVVLFGAPEYEMFVSA
jgi:hypothetical protein